MDQATDLRALVRQVATTHSPAAPRPRRIVVFGGKGGVGVTTVAVNLAAALAHARQRTVLLDAAGGDVSLQCRLESRHTLSDVLAGNRTLQNIIEPGPAGVQIVPAARESVGWHDAAEHAWSRMLAQLPSLEPRPEVVVIDAGSQPNPLARLLWQGADRVLLVATVETAAIMDAYASIKMLTDPARSVSIALLVNRSPQESLANEAQQRLVQACRRFLGLPLRRLGHLPEDSAVPRCAARGEPLVLAMPASAAGQVMRNVARAIMSQATARQPVAA